MTIFQAILLSIIQGVTEFLPISSSGHLVLFQKIFNISEAPILFDVLLHLGTLTAIFIFFNKEIISLIKNWRKKKNTWLFLFVGTLPAAFFGYLFNSKTEKIFNSLSLLAFCWIFFGLLLLLSCYFRFRKRKLTKTSDLTGWKDGLIIGLFQAIALLPGVSRSGSTMVGSFWRGFSRSSAFELSFLLSIPAIFGAAVLELKDGRLDSVSIPVGVFCMFLSALVGYFSLKFLLKVLKSDKFYWFGFYCLALGILVLFLKT